MAIWLHGVLHPTGDEEVRDRRMGRRPRPDVRDGRSRAVVFDSVDAIDHIGLAEERADERHQHVRLLWPMKATSIGAQCPTAGIDGGRPLAKVVIAPVFGIN